MKKIVWISLIVVIALLLLGNLFTYSLQEHFIFQPDKLAADFRFDPGVPYTELFLKAEDGATINALFMMTTDIDPKGCVLYLHGNAGSLQRWSELHSIFTDNGYNVLMPDFRGFGKSTGKLNEANFLKDAVMCLEWLQDHCTPDRIIIYGRSMGTAVAAYVSSIHAPDQLILETPYSSLKKLFFSYYPFMPPLFIFKFNLDTELWLRNLDAPVTIFHGTEDWIIPLDNALQLKQSLKETDRFIIIEGASHNDIGAFRAYKETMDNLLTCQK